MNPKIELKEIDGKFSMLQQEILIIHVFLDDIGYVKKDDAQTSVLFELIADRYETNSLIKRQKSLKVLAKLTTEEAIAITQLTKKLRNRIPNGKHYTVENKTIKFLPKAKEFQLEKYDFSIKLRESINKVEVV